MTNVVYLEELSTVIYFLLHLQNILRTNNQLHQNVHVCAETKTDNVMQTSKVKGSRQAL